MTTPNPAAIEAAARAMYEYHRDEGAWDRLDSGWQAEWLNQAEIAYAAMEPHIRRAVAEELTATTGLTVRTEIRKILGQVPFMPDDDRLNGAAQAIIDLVVPPARLQEHARVVEEFAAGGWCVEYGIFQDRTGDGLGHAFLATRLDREDADAAVTRLQTEHPGYPAYAKWRIVRRSAWERLAGDVREHGLEWKA